MKKFLTLFLLFILMVALSGCKPKKPKAIILFNKYPITKENFLNNSTEFDTQKRIYYVYMTEKGIRTDKIRVKVFKRESKARDSITKLVYCHDFKMKYDNIYYYTDYIVLHTAGDYCMMVFQMDRLDKPDAYADLRVK